ncbi:MAG: glutamine--tRNA ligase/YqeY domain fusion protein [Candidatus Zophobacter franzmannii]|nr:glutamine--tRNA ligase/YqeY domain fusion protein [Candidatus Zophobacter franzmannii]
MNEELKTTEVEEKEKPSNFIKDIVEADIAKGKNNGSVHTRFPPEPNGYLHIGHAKAICIDFGIAKDYNGQCNLRFDDTNPIQEDIEYVDSIQEDIKWLGFDWEDRLFYASNYFDNLYAFAEELIKMGKAFVDDLTGEEIREYRGTVKSAGKNSPYRDRSVEENLDLFHRMKAGEFEDGAKTLRSKIDMSSPNMNMRDPIIYRIKRAHHHRTGDKWCIYPMYDFTHCLSDMLEGITHSLCSLEFEDHRPLYDWYLDSLKTPCHPQQIEFARLNVNYTLTSKRKLQKLVNEDVVDGWDDPRMPTISGLRRRGFTPHSIREFCDRVGVAKAASIVDVAFLNFCLREEMNHKAPRVMVVQDPLKVVITNYPEGDVEWFDAENNPEDESAGTRKVPFSREIYIEREDFREEANRKYFRLKLGHEVRLKHAYYILANEAIKDADGNITEVHCTYDPKSRGGWSDDGRKVKGTLHWVSIEQAIPTKVRLYDHLFTVENPSKSESEIKDIINPESIVVMENAFAEPSLKEAKPEDHFQFLRKGYFVADRYDFSTEKLVFNRTVGLRDSFAKKDKNPK